MWRPERPVELIAGTPTGGGQDRAARALVEALDEAAGIPMSISNVAGRGGGNAWDILETRPGDGHTLSISSPTLITNRVTGESDLQVENLTPIAMLCAESIVFAVPATSRLADVHDLIDALASDDKPTVSLATARGNINHIALAYLCRHVDLDPGEIEISVFDSAPKAIADAVTGPHRVAAVSAASVVPGFTDGSLRPLGVSAPVRLGEPLAEVPTFTEAGIDCTIGVWRGVVGPPHLDPDVVSFWAGAIGAAVSATNWQRSLKRHVWSDAYMGPVETSTFLRSEDDRLTTALRDFGLTSF
ncbi:MAG: putative tricarboxylic transport membrane protein [Verrucomicrobiales bacterium]|jgi:putative tricarboxylic transport membrane protein